MFVERLIQTSAENYTIIRGGFVTDYGGDSAKRFAKIYFLV